MILARWILFTGLVWMGGCVTVRWLLAGSRGVDPTASEAGPGRAGPVRDDPAATSRRKRLEGRLARWGFFAAGLTFAGVLTLGVAQLLEFRDPFAPLRSEAALLFLRTSWGQAWIAAVVGLCSAMAAFGLVRGRGSWVLVTVLVVALAFFPALTGHAVGTEELTVLAVLADGAHVLAAGAWIGSLGVIMLLAIPSRAAHPDGEVLPELLPRFSATALISAGVLALTGIFGSWLHLPSFSALSGSGYGRLLLLKLALVFLVLALGFRNWRRWRRGLRDQGTPEADRGPILVELLAAHLVLAVTAFLVSTAPPALP